MASEVIERQPWERQPGESARAYAAFCVYLNLGPQRSIQKAFEAKSAPDAPQKRPVNGTWKAWCSRFRWTERTNDYSLYLELIARQEREAEHNKELEAYRARQKHLAQATTDSAMKLVNLANQKIEELQKAYDDWKARLEAAETPAERAEIRRNDPINLLSIPNWIRAAASVAQVATDAESQALAVNELLHMLEDSDRFRLPMTPER